VAEDRLPGEARKRTVQHDSANIVRPGVKHFYSFEPVGDTNDQEACLVERRFNGGPKCLEVHVTTARSREEFLRLPEELQNRLTPPTCDDAVNVAVYDPASFPQRIKVEASVQDSMLVERVTPVDPPQGVTGAVQLIVVVGKDGSVIDVKPVDGPQSLIDCAIAAVRRWRYPPTLLNGRPVEVQTSIEVSFLSP
jgi:hypothetical protein